MEQVNFLRCENCGAMVEVIKACDCENCGIRCCGKPMVKEKAQFTSANSPLYKVIGSYVVAWTEGRHDCAFIGLLSDRINAKKYFQQGEKGMAVFPYICNSILYINYGSNRIYATKVK